MSESTNHRWNQAKTLARSFRGSLELPVEAAWIEEARDDSMLSAVSFMEAAELAHQRHKASRPPIDALVLSLTDALIHEALRKDYPTHHLHYWYSETLRLRLADWAASVAGSSVGSRALRFLVQDMITLGINLRHATVAEFSASWTEAWSRRFSHVNPARPCVVFAAVTAALAFGAIRTDHILEVLHMGPANPAACLSWFGMLAGVYPARHTEVF